MDEYMDDLDYYYYYHVNHTYYDENITHYINDAHERKAARYLTLSLAPILILLGNIGNGLCILVLLSTNVFKNMNCRFLLTVLAIADIGVLDTGLLRLWIHEITNAYDVRSANVVVCKVHVYFTYFFPQFSSWIIVLLSIDRMISIRFPLKAKILFNFKQMVVALVIITIILACNTIYPAKEHHLVYGEFCIVNAQDHKLFSLITEWNDFLVVSALPIIIITTMNSLIIYQILRNQQSSANSQRRIESTTILLIIMSLVFIITTLPRSVYFLGSHWNNLSHAQVDLFYRTVIIIYNISNAVNFLLYCISNAKFREELYRRVCCRVVNPNNSRSSVSSYAGLPMNPIAINGVNVEQPLNLSYCDGHLLEGTTPLVYKEGGTNNTA